MTDCKKCGTPAYMPFTCSRCGGTFCKDHRISHDCISVTAIESGKITEKELVTMAIRSKLRETIDKAGEFRSVDESMDYVKRKVVKDLVSALRGNALTCTLLPWLLLMLGIAAAFINVAAGALLVAASAVSMAIIARTYHGMKDARGITGDILGGQKVIWAAILHRTWVARAAADMVIHVAWIAYSIIMVNWISMIFVTLSTLISMSNIKPMARKERLLERACAKFGL
jgi:hypothetical protein